MGADHVTAASERGPRGTNPTIRYRATICFLTPANTDMSLPHSIAVSSRKRKHSAAEHGGRGVGSSGTNLGDLHGPPPAPAHLGHLQGQEYDNTRKTLF